MELNNEHIDAIRDVALFLEESDTQISVDLISVAILHRPNGPVLIEKFNFFKKQYSPSKRVELSFVKACKKVQANLPIFAIFIDASLTIYPRNNALKKLYGEMQPTLYLQRQVDILESQIELLRNKSTQLHKALCYSEVFRVKKIDDYAAKVCPVEFFDKGAYETLIVFGGMATAPSMPPKEFFASFLEKDLNIIFVKDFEQCWYQKGLVGLSEDINSTVDYLRELIPARTTKLTCLGTSAGGYAAIRIGVSLGAQKILSFAPQTKIDTEIFEKFKSLDSRLTDVSLNNKIDLDLQLFLSKEKYAGQIDVYYGSKNINDVNAAKYISDYSNLYSHETDIHSIASYLKSTGQLSEILDAI